MVLASPPTWQRRDPWLQRRKNQGGLVASMALAPAEVAYYLKHKGGLDALFSAFLSFSQLFSAFLSFSQLFSAFLSFSQLLPAYPLYIPQKTWRPFGNLWGPVFLGTHTYIFFCTDCLLELRPLHSYFSKNHQVLGSPMQHLPVEVLICACDTFRAGAVEQLKTHSRWTSCAGVACCKTSKWWANAWGVTCRCLDVPLFERGYGKELCGSLSSRDLVWWCLVYPDLETSFRIQLTLPRMRLLMQNPMVGPLLPDAFPSFSDVQSLMTHVSWTDLLMVWGHDVVLVDTAGRMQARLGTAWYSLVRLCGGACCEAWQTECCELQLVTLLCFEDNEPLMRALAKLVAINSPDLVWNPRVGKSWKELNSAVQMCSAQCLILLSTPRFFLWVKRLSAMMP